MCNKNVVSKNNAQEIKIINLNFRARIKRLTRETIFFSKKDDMHCGMVKAYCCKVNQGLAASSAGNLQHYLIFGQESKGAC